MNEANMNTSLTENTSQNTGNFAETLPETFFDEIVIISDKKESIPVDLGSVDTTIIPFSAPENALYHILTKKENDLAYSALVLCDYHFRDFDAALLVSLLRLHPLGTLFPIGIIFNMPKSAEDSNLLNKEMKNLRILGASFFLIRPFTFQEMLDTFREAYEQQSKDIQKYYNNLLALEKANEEKRTLFLSNWEQKLASFEKGFMRFFYTPDENAPFEEQFEIGEQKYHDRLFNQATTCFERSSAQDSPHKSDALVYLYGIQKEQGQPEKGKVYLEQALHSFIESGEWDKVTESTEIFMQDFPEEQNPLYGALQKNFALTNYTTVNNILEIAEKILPTDEIASFLLQINGTKKFPPAITGYLEKHKELQQIIFQSNIKDMLLDGDEYRREQERIRAITYLEQQRLSRIRGNQQSAGSTGSTAGTSASSSAGRPASNQSAQSSPNSKTSSQAEGKAQASTGKSQSANGEKTQGEPQLREVEHMPTVMISGGKGRFLDDMINMAKYTKNFIKKNK